MALWLNTEAVKAVTCPKCGAGAGNPCLTPTARIADKTHDARVQEFMTQPGFDIRRFQVKTLTMAEVMARMQK